jgi:hypothetical protein
VLHDRGSFNWAEGHHNLSQDAAGRVFQSLATVAGHDPVRGPGSSCLDPRASGKCVLPWGNGTKSVSSIVLLTNGIGFAVRITFSGA